MRFATLDEWLNWQERLHPRSIDLTLDRVYRVRDALGFDRAPYESLVVGGTNGKGSCAAMLSSLLQQAGHRTGRYLSPHLVRYNERIAVDDVEATGTELCAAFDAVDRARGDTSLTYFEFGTLAALEHFRRSACDVVVLEVGLGGRLDATNVLEHEAAIVVSVGIDHTDWLGPDRESIGFEKAGIYRGGRPAVCADTAPPASLVKHASGIGARLLRAGREYRYSVRDDRRWDFTGGSGAYEALPAPAIPGRVQYGNAAAALAALDALPGLFPPDAGAVARGLEAVRLPGRMQRVSVSPEIIIDVSHNPDGVRALARQLASSPVPGRCYAVCAMLADKRIPETLSVLDTAVDYWLFAGLGTERGIGAEEMTQRATAAGLRGPAETHETVTGALVRARELARAADRIIVFGSFLTAGEALSDYL